MSSSVSGLLDISFAARLGVCIISSDDGLVLLALRLDVDRVVCSVFVVGVLFLELLVGDFLLRLRCFTCLLAMVSFVSFDDPNSCFFMVHIWYTTHFQ